MARPLQIDIVVLAAGASARLGAPKQLIQFNGTTLLRRTVETALHSTAHAVHAVFGFEAGLIQKEIADFPIDVVINAYWHRGISTSLRAGILSLDRTIDAALIILCDQPKLSPAILNALIDAYTSTHAPIVTCTYAGTVGVPTLYDRCVFPELLSLEGNYGAKKIIERYRKEQIEVDFVGGEIDIDTIADQRDMS